MLQMLQVDLGDAIFDPFEQAQRGLAFTGDEVKGGTQLNFARPSIMTVMNPMCAAGCLNCVAFQLVLSILEDVHCFRWRFKKNCSVWQPLATICNQLQGSIPSPHQNDPN